MGSDILERIDNAVGPLADHLHDGPDEAIAVQLLLECKDEIKRLRDVIEPEESEADNGE